MTQPCQLAHSNLAQTTPLESANSLPFFKRTAEVIHILATEIHATLRYVLPNAVSWVWRKYVCNEIRTIEIKAEKAQRVAYLNIHGTLPSTLEGKAHAVVLCHGDHGHPYSMLHLADIAQRERLPTFSVHIPGTHNNQQFEGHNDLLRQAIDKIETLLENRSGLGGILGVGHSKGAILLAQRQFVNLDQRIKAVCAIGGRLNVPYDSDCPDKILAGIVRNIYQGILGQPERPLMQLVPVNDWNASQEAMAVRPNDHCYSVPGMHLSGLFTSETRQHFTHFLREFA